MALIQEDTLVFAGHGNSLGSKESKRRSEKKVLRGTPKLCIFRAQGFYACFNKGKIVTLKNAIQMTLSNLSVI